MKKYISILLITLIIFQAGGCYSQKLITYDDFRRLPVTTEASIDTKDEGTIDLTSKTAEGTSLHWKKGVDTLTIFYMHLKRSKSNTLQEVTDTLNLPSSEISKIYISEYDEVKTIIAVGFSVLAGVAAIYLIHKAIQNSGFSMHY